MSKLDDFFDNLDVKNRGYMVNRYLTNGGFILLLLLIVCLFFVDGVGVFTGITYIECSSDSDSFCFNPYYLEYGCNKPICENQFLSVGEGVGDKPSFLTSSFWWIAILVIGLTLLLNHLLYNVKVKK